MIDPILMQKLAMISGGADPWGAEPDIAEMSEGGGEIMPLPPRPGMPPPAPPPQMPGAGVRDALKRFLRPVFPPEGELRMGPAGDYGDPSEMLGPRPGGAAAMPPGVQPFDLDAIIQSLRRSPDLEGTRPGPGMGAAMPMPRPTPRPGLPPVMPGRNVGMAPGMGPDVAPSMGVAGDYGDPQDMLQPRPSMAAPPDMRTLTGERGEQKLRQRGFDPLLWSLAIAAGNRPGSSLIGAVGRGGLAAMQQQAQDRRLDVAEQREERAMRQGDRRLDIEQQRTDALAQQRLDELAARRERNEQLATDAKERMQIQRDRDRLASMDREERLAFERRIDESRRADAAEKRKLDADKNVSNFIEARSKLLSGGLGGELTPQQQTQLDNEVLTTFGPKTTYGRQVVARQLADAVAKINSLNLPDAEKQRRIGEARKRYEEAVGP